MTMTQFYGPLFSFINNFCKETRYGWKLRISFFSLIMVSLWQHLQLFLSLLYNGFRWNRSERRREIYVTGKASNAVWWCLLNQVIPDGSWHQRLSHISHPYSAKCRLLACGRYHSLLRLFEVSSLKMWLWILNCGGLRNDQVSSFAKWKFRSAFWMLSQRRYKTLFNLVGVKVGTNSDCNSAHLYQALFRSDCYSMMSKKSAY